MSERRRFRPPLLVVAGLAVALGVGGCTSTSNTDGGSAATVVTSGGSTVGGPAAGSTTAGSTTAGSTTAGAAGTGATAAGAVSAPDPDPAPAGGITVVAPAGEPTAGGSTSGAPDSGAAGSGAAGATDAAGSAASTTATTTTTPKPKPKPKPKPAQITTAPGARATNVDPRQQISVSAKGGTVLWVKVINPEKKVVQQATVNKTSWSWAPELGFGRKYIVRTASKSTNGVIKVTDSTFTTLKPSKLVSASVFPNNGTTYGVGQPIVIRFSQPIADKDRRKVESMIQIDRTIGQAGAYRWFSKTEVHWRPAQLWKGGSTVEVRLNIYARQLSGGAYGQQDTVTRFKIGERVTSIVDGKKHTMEVYKNFKLVKVIPVSLGNTKYPTYNGTHVITEKHPTYTMDSSTWGLKGAGAYVTKVKWATRISDSGEFVHGAPWSVDAQGNSNVSHGCINMTDVNAKWFQDMSRPGDVVIVKNSTGKTMDVGDRYGDWNIPWGKY